MSNRSEILAFLFGVAGGTFLLITLIVFLVGHTWRLRAPSDGIAWIGGPSGSEHGVSMTSLALTSRKPEHDTPVNVDWPALAQTAEPGRYVGGASAAW